MFHIYHYLIYYFFSYHYLLLTVSALQPGYQIQQNENTNNNSKNGNKNTSRKNGNSTRTNGNSTSSSSNTRDSTNSLNSNTNSSSGDTNFETFDYDTTGSISEQDEEEKLSNYVFPCVCVCADISVFYRVELHIL